MSTKYCNTKRARGSLALSFILSTGMILTTLPVAYAVPMMTNYQGTLKDSKGKLLNNSVVTLTFAVYDVPASGTALWTETHSGVSVKDGAFSVVLGSVVNIPESVVEGERYLGVTVNTDAEMTPRQALVSGFFAMRAGVAESVVSGSVTSDNLVASAVTTEKVADSAVTTTKLAPTAVTGEKLAVDSVTTDKIANGTVTTEKLSTEVQEKLAQGSSMPATVTTPVTMTTLNVTEKLKVGKNSLYLGPLASGGTDNSIYTDGSDLLVQSDPSQIFNTVINANNAGNVGIGTSDPKSKLTVAGNISVSSSEWALPQQPGLNFYFDGVFTEGGEIASIFKTSLPFEFSPLSVTAQSIIMTSKKGIPSSSFAPIRLTGSPIILNGDFTATQVDGNVGIGTKTPKNKLDVAGSVAIGSGYAGTQIAPANGLAVEGNVAVRNFVFGTAPEADNSWIQGTWLNDMVSWDTTTKRWKRKQAEWNAIVGIVQRNETMAFLSRGAWEPGLEWTNEDFFKQNTTLLVGSWQVGINTTDPQHALDVIGSVQANDFIRRSDKKFKQDIKPLTQALGKVSKLQGVTYKWDRESYPDMRFDDQVHIGFIAQEVEPVLPELVSTDSQGYKSVSYDNMTAVLVEAVKELKAQNDALKTIVCKDHPEEVICQ